MMRQGIGAADGVRTRDFQNHNLALLPAELQPPQLQVIVASGSKKLAAAVAAWRRTLITARGRSAALRGSIAKVSAGRRSGC